MEAKQIRVLVTDPLSKEGVAILKNEGFEVEETGKLTPAELAGKVKGFDALVVRSGTRVNREAIAAADNLKVIGRAGVGLDNVDLESATAKGIIVMNSPEGNTISTAEHAFALILSMMRNIPEAHHSVREGRWEKKGFTDDTTVANTLAPFKGEWRLYYGGADRVIGAATFALPGPTR